MCTSAVVCAAAARGVGRAVGFGLCGVAGFRLGLRVAEVCPCGVATLVRLCVCLRGGLVVVSCSEAGIVVVGGSGVCACSHLVGGAAVWQAPTGRLNERSVRVCMGGVATFGALGAVFACGTGMMAGVGICGVAGSGVAVECP
jgi:hypothetical protein